jgi:predicted nuclease of predicted toxin-antitoxin system
MKFLFDESVDLPIALYLQDIGYDVQSITQTMPGITDNQVLEQAVRLEAVLVTIDKDFGELVYRMKIQSRGVILLRLEGLPMLQKAKILESVILAHSEELEAAFTVITQEQVRIRPLRQN